MDNTIPQDAPQKQCTKCKQWMPATLEYFYRDKSKKDGLEYNCKTCRNVRYIKHPRVLNHLREEKVCKKCQQIKPIDDFIIKTKKTISSVTTNSMCKKCMSEQRKQYRNDHYDEVIEMERTRYLRNIERKKEQDRQRRQSKEYKERARALNKEWIKNNPEKWRQSRKETRKRHPETRREWVARNIEKVRSQKRAAYYRIDPLVRREQSRKYRQANLDKILARNRNRYTRQKGIQGKHTAQQLREQYHHQKGKCYYCRHKIKWGEHHVDHTFPLSRVVGTDIPANDIAYLVITCKTCNLKKHDKFPWEWPEGGRLM